MKVNGVDFNEEWTKGKTEEAFISFFLPKIWASQPEEERRKKLAEAYKIIAKKDEPKAAPKAKKENQSEPSEN